MIPLRNNSNFADFSLITLSYLLQFMQNMDNFQQNVNSLICTTHIVHRPKIFLNKSPEKHKALFDLHTFVLMYLSVIIICTYLQNYHNHCKIQKLFVNTPCNKSRQPHLRTKMNKTLLARKQIDSQEFLFYQSAVHKN